MASRPDDIRERAWVDHRLPSTDLADERLWIAEDPVTECAGVGQVELEAMGNLVSAVTEYEESGETGDPLLKTPGRVVTRSSPPSGSSSTSLFDRLLSLF